MSIKPLKKVTVCGLTGDKEWLLDRIQAFGVMHLVPMRAAQRDLDQVPTGRADDAYKALRHLTDYPERRRQVREQKGFDIETTVAHVLANKQGLRNAGDRRDALIKRIRDLTPWGDINFPREGDLVGYKLWFYTVPHKEMPQVRASDLVWQTIRRDHRYCYVAVIAQDEPPGNALPVPRTHTGALPRSELQRQLEAIEIELEDLIAEREALTKWIFLMSANLAAAEDKAARERVAAETLDESDFFALQGWLRADQVAGAKAFADEHGLALVAEDPGANDTPPTLLENPANVSGGEDLVQFYKTPAYGDWDPSAIVFYSFVLFFAMIMADAGYGLVLAGIVAYFWQRMGQAPSGLRLRKLAAWLVGGTVAFGVLSGGYFGFAPPEGSVLALIDVIDLNDIDAMMKLSITIGVGHIVLASVIKAMRAATPSTRWQPLGWSGAAVGGLLMYLGSGTVFASVGIVLIVAGLVLVVLFGSDRAFGSAKDGALRALDGLMSLTAVGKIFGDILSYMRLFALGLAGSSLALTVNNLADQVAHAVPGPGILLGILIVLIGHVINLSLCVMSGVVHGLRLNVIEFFNWGLEAEDGRPFRPFAKKEVTP